MKKCSGFTIIEMLVVITVLVILIAAGGFYYRDLNRHSTAREAKEFAINFANALNDIYKSNNFDVTNDDLTDINPNSFRRGTYPNTKDMGALLSWDESPLVKSSENYKDRVFTETWGDVALKETFNHYPTFEPVKFSHGVNPQQFLEQNAKKIFYQPILANKNHAGDYQICYSNTGREFECRVVIIYYVKFEDGQYRLKPAAKLEGGFVNVYD